MCPHKIDRIGYICEIDKPFEWNFRTYFGVIPNDLHTSEIRRKFIWDVTWDGSPDRCVHSSSHFAVRAYAVCWHLPGEQDWNTWTWKLPGCMPRRNVNFPTWEASSGRDPLFKNMVILFYAKWGKWSLYWHKQPLYSLDSRFTGETDRPLKVGYILDQKTLEEWRLLNCSSNA